MEGNRVVVLDRGHVLDNKHVLVFNFSDHESALNVPALNEYILSL
jgi:hypothetical protein